jgi:hypothetical protein
MTFRAMRQIKQMLKTTTRWWRRGWVERQAAGPKAQAEIMDALSIYMGGNRDSGHLRALASAYPEQVLEAILRCQTIVAGQRSELCELTLTLGYVDRWGRDARSDNQMIRRKALSCLSAVAHCEPVRRFLGDIPASALCDPDDRIRVEAARMLLATGEPALAVQVFERALADSGVRLAIAGELGRHAIQLCMSAIPQALRSQNPGDILKLLVSWERALPLVDVRPLAEHSDPKVRAEVMRLLPFLPATPENRSAILAGLADEDHDVSAAAAAAAGRMRLPELNSVA